MIHIRAANLNDAGAICRLNRDCLGYDYALEKTQRRLADILSAGQALVLVAETDARVVGYIHAGPYECSYVDSLKDILSLAVDPDYRNMGAGRMLLNAVEEWAVRTGSAGVRLVSGYEREGAHRFYRSCGYTNRKDQKNFIKIFSDNIHID